MAVPFRLPGQWPKARRGHVPAGPFARRFGPAAVLQEIVDQACPCHKVGSISLCERPLNWSVLSREGSQEKYVD